MTANRHRQNGRGRSTGRRNELIIAAGTAAALAMLITAACFLSSRPGQTTAVKPEVQLADATPRNGSSPVPVPQRRIEGDQRIAATPRLQSDGDAIAVEHGPEGSDGELPATGQTPDENPPGTQGAGEVDAKNPRSLLRQARRQVRSGQTQGALETSRQIASVVGDDDSRSKIESKVRDAEAAAGAGQLVDFDSLIQLIEQVIAPNSWSSVGGAGTVTSFPGGVYIDTAGLMQQRTRQVPAQELARVRDQARPSESAEYAHDQPGLRKVSLPRLEQAVSNRLAQGQALTEEMRYLAGLVDIRYVLVYPEEHDIVVVGQAEDWKTDELGRVVGRQSERPVLQLDDLAVILRACFSESQNHGLFGCGIYPRAQRLQQVQDFLARSAAAGPIDPSQRDRWLAELRNQLGEQDIEIFGIHPGSRVAHVLVEADYRMKLIGIGLEPAAVPGIPSYFDLLGQPDDARLNRPIDTLRWWFTLNYDEILASDTHDAFELRGARVQVLSENELLTATGQRVHTGQSDPINALFAKNFTDQFAALAARDVNFADLAGIFDLAVLAGLLRTYDLPRSAGWTLTALLDPDELIVSLNPPPRTVETVMNHRVYRGRNIMAAISGGVHVNPWNVVSADHMRTDSGGTLPRLKSDAHQVSSANAPWWWD